MQRAEGEGPGFGLGLVHETLLTDSRSSKLRRSQAATADSEKPAHRGSVGRLRDFEGVRLKFFGGACGLRLQVLCGVQGLEALQGFRCAGCRPAEFEIEGLSEAKACKILVSGSQP